jgi:hypothetical protein
MTTRSIDHLLPDAPRGAIAGEFITATCFGCLALFLPTIDWFRWPELLFNWHFAVVVVGTSAAAVALFTRRSEALKPAIVLAAYVGLPSLVSLSQALGQIRAFEGNPAVTLSYVVWGVGLLGQVVVILTCLGRLALAQPLSTDRSEQAAVQDD